MPLHPFLMYIHLLRETIYFVFFYVSLNCYVLGCFIDFHFRFVSDSRALETTENFARNIASVKRIPHLFFWSFLYNKLKFTLKSIDEIVLSFRG